MKFSVITLGCTLNKAEGDIMKNILIKKDINIQKILMKVKY